MIITKQKPNKAMNKQKNIFLLCFYEKLPQDSFTLKYSTNQHF